VGHYAARYGIPLPLSETIHTEALRERIPVRLAFRLVHVESRFRPDAVSSAGAVGLAQVLPSTARWIEPGVTRTALFEPETNLRLGFQYLRYLLDRYDGDTRLALLAYNRGPNRVARIVRRGEDPTNGYARKVLIEAP